MSTNLPSQMVTNATTKPLKIAIVYSRALFPMNYADQKTVAHLIEFLSTRGHSVDLYCTDVGGEVSESADAWYASRVANLYMFRHGRIARLFAMAGAFLQRKPLQVGYFWNSRLSKVFNKNYASYDTVYTYYLRSAEVTKTVRENRGEKAPVSVLALQLSQSLNTKRIYENASNFFDRFLYFIESRLIARYEARIWQSFDTTILIGDKDVDAINAACERYRQPMLSNVFQCAHGVDVSKFLRPNIVRKQNALLYCGVMQTPTNVQACLWFYNNVWPLVKETRPDVHWYIVGRSPTQEILNLACDPAITVTGTVTDPSDFISTATVCINPMQAAGGMQNKLIEYMASRRAVVATSVANEGIGGCPDRHLLIADTARDFASRTLELLDDEQRRRALEEEAFIFVKEKWSWESHFLALEGVFYPDA